MGSPKGETPKKAFGTPAIPEREELWKKIKNDLLWLAQNDEKKMGKERKDTHKKLMGIKQKLDVLTEHYPNEPDILLFGASLADFIEDYDRDANTELDKSFDMLMDHMRPILKDAGVIQQSIREAIKEKSKFGDTLRKLRSLNIHPEHVTRSPKPNAPTVILFMQSHGEPDGVENITSEEQWNRPEIIRAFDSKLTRTGKSTEESQIRIEAAITKCINAGMGSVLYDEAAEYGKTFNTDHFQSQRYKDDKQSFIRLIRKFGDKIRVIGYDTDELKDIIFKGKMDLMYRLAAHNPFIASNFAQIHSKIDSQEEVSYMSIGGIHESYPNNAVEHHIPISHALAYYGFNVIVIDEAFQKTSRIR